MATSTRVGWKVSHLSNLSSRKKNHTWKWQAALGRAIHFLGMPPQLWLRNQLSLPSNIWQIWATYFATHFRSRWCESGPNKSMMRIIVNLDPKKCDVNHRESGHQKKSPHVFHHHTLWCWNKWSTSGTERKLSKSLESWQHRVDVCRRGTWYPWGCHEKRWDIHGYQWNIGHFFCHWNIEMRIWWLTETIISLFWMKTIYPSLSHQLGLGSCQRETVLTCGLFLERTVSETTTNHGDICDLSWLVW